MIRLMKQVVVIAGALALFGCGGGGGGTAGEGGKTTVNVPVTSAVLKLSTEGSLPSGTSLAGIGITVNLPPGLTVKTDSSGKVEAGSVAGSGVTAGKAMTAEPDYTPPTANVPGKLTLVLASTEPQGFGTGEFATVTCDVAAGTTPKATDFTLSGFSPVDLRGAAVSGLSVTHTAEFK